MDKEALASDRTRQVSKWYGNIDDDRTKLTGSTPSVAPAAAAGSGGALQPGGSDTRGGD